MDVEKCLICLEDIKEDYYISSFCKCKQKYHHKCFEDAYLNSFYKCCICKKYNYIDVLKHYYNEYEKIYESYIILINNNCACKIKNVELNKYIKLEFLRNSVIPVHCDLFYFNKEELNEILNICSKNKNKFQYNILLLLKKCIKHVISVKNID